MTVSLPHAQVTTTVASALPTSAVPLGLAVSVTLSPPAFSRGEACLDIVRREGERLHHDALGRGGIGTREPRARQHRRDRVGVVLAHR
ncbi:MAG: hypothetical protein WAU59_08465, partial [Rhodoplanes sp.]